MGGEGGLTADQYLQLASMAGKAAGTMGGQGGGQGGGAVPPPLPPPLLSSNSNQAPLQAPGTSSDMQAIIAKLMQSQGQGQQPSPFGQGQQF